MVTRKAIASILEDYEDIVVATACSHSSLQIFHGARQEGFRTLGIAIGQRPRFYDAFPLAKPDEFLIVDSYADILDQADDLVARQAVTVPHGSFVEYMGADVFAKLPIPTFGNREVLRWESDRDKQREWLTSAGVPMPLQIEHPKDIDRPVFVKYYGAKGGRGSFIAKNYEDFKESIQPGMKFTIQEYVVGTRYYIHYFYSPFATSGYTLSKGGLEMLGVDRRDEANIDEMYKLGAQEALRKMGLLPTFVVTGNMPVVLRESLLPKAFEMGEVTVGVILLIVALGIATYLETRYLRKKMKNRRVRTAKRDDELQDNAHNVITTTKAIVSSLQRQGIRSEEADAWLQEAQTANARHNYRVAMDLTAKAKDRLLALKAAQASKGDLAKLDRLSLGGSTDEMTTKEMLQKEIPPNMLQSKFSIEVAGTAVELGRLNGRDVSQATQLLEAAKTRFDAKDYASALTIARQSKRAAAGEQVDVSIALAAPQSPPTPGGRTCPSCGATLAEDDMFCRKCGARLALAACSSCGASLLSDDAYCPKCGTPVAQ